jgi:hypothetical protein
MALDSGFVAFATPRNDGYPLFLNPAEMPLMVN